MGIGVFDQVDRNQFFSISNIDKNLMKQYGINLSIKQLRAKARATVPFDEILTGQREENGYMRKTKIYRYIDFVEGGKKQCMGKS